MIDRLFFLQKILIFKVQILVINMNVFLEGIGDMLSCVIYRQKKFIVVKICHLEIKQYIYDTKALNMLVFLTKI